MKFLSCIILMLFISSLFGQQYEGFEFAPQQYVAYLSKAPLSIDGQLDEKSWQLAKWTREFVDIEGDHAPAPPYRSTRVKMLWDEDYFYIGAELEEPHVWATYDERDAVIYHENDFEVFIDPDGDTHNYYELEINALGTVWDLLILKPYRDGGPALNAWDMRGLKSAVFIEGTLNNPDDTDKKWSIELALPWEMLKEAAKNSRKPKDGEQWRVNFSRVQWRIKNIEGRYEKEINPATGKNYPEFNWVWSEQGKIAMHQPETWGYVQFSENTVGQETAAFIESPLETIKWSLFQLYYAQKAFFRDNKCYEKEPGRLPMPPSHLEALKANTEVFVTPVSFLAIYEDEKVKFNINHEGKLQNLSKP